MANAALQEEIHNDDNEIDDEGSPMSTTLPSNFQYTTRSRSQSSNRRKSKLDEQIAVGIDKLVSAFHEVKADMSQNMFESSEDHDYIGRELASMGLSVDDELIALNLMIEKPSHIKSFKVLRNDRDRKLTYIRILLREHERRAGV